MSSRSTLPHAGYALPAYYLIAPAEASANLSRFDGVRFGLRCEEPGDTVVDMYGRTRAAGFGAEVKRRIMLGTYALSAGYYDAYYGMAQKVRTTHPARLRRGASPASTSMVTPTSPTVAFRHRRAGGRPVGDVCLRRADGAREPGRPARHLDPLRPQRGAAGGLPAGRAGVLREPHPRGRARARARARHSIPGRRRCAA